MEPWASPFLLAGAWLIATIFYKIFKMLDFAINYAAYRFDGFSITKCFKNYYNYKILKWQVRQKMRKQIHDKIFYYYLNECINNNIELAYDLASRDLKEIEKNKQLIHLYNQHFGDLYKIETAV